jgi:two-component system, cell cycle response regulator DivK
MTKILVVEDETPNVEILTRLLGRKGYEVVVAGTKQDAIEAASSEQLDLILMDIGIPDAPGEVPNHSGGLEAMKLLKSAEATKSIPIIATTASAMLDEQKRFLAAGCDAVATKPYDFGSLLKTIESQLPR